CSSGVAAIAASFRAVSSGRWSTSGRGAVGLLRESSCLGAGFPELLSSVSGAASGRVRSMPRPTTAMSTSSTIPTIQCLTFICTHFNKKCGLPQNVRNSPLVFVLPKIVIEARMLDYIQSVLAEPWKPISRGAVIAWLVFYAAFLAYAFSAHGGFLL